MLNVQRLRVLKEVAAHRSFSAAAEALSYTQSAVSQAVASLEAETGATLIERDRRGVRPTAIGAVLLGHADGILGRLNAAEAELAAITGVRGGRLRIASFPTAGAAPGGPARGVVGADLRRQPLRPPRRALLPRGGVRPGGVVRERRLRHRAGPGRRRRGRGADPAARAVERPQGDPRAPAAPSK